MKKVFSIFAALLILFSGMQVTLSRHLCMGEFAAAKWSVDGTAASCGMTHQAGTPSPFASFNPDCCHNDTFTYAVDENYSPSSGLQLLNMDYTGALAFIIPQSLLWSANFVSNLKPHMVFPEKDLLAGSLPLSGLHNFRI